MLEAMSAGCLIIGSKTPPVQEVIHEKYNGLLVDFFSSQEIAERTIEALDRPDAFKTLRHNARRTIVEHYDLHTQCLPAQLRLMQELAQPTKPYLWKRTARRS